MSKLAIILGAGASVDAGAPLMRNYFDVAERVRLSLPLPSTERQRFEAVFEARTRLQSLQNVARIEVDNIEQVFALFELAETCGRLADLSKEKIQALPGAIVQVIVSTLERSIIYPVKEASESTKPASRDKEPSGGSFVKVMPAGHYGDFLNGVRQVVGGKMDNASVITFNYDIAIDWAAKVLDIPISYGLEEPDSVKNGCLPILKLHGSSNWGVCRKCDKVVALDMSTFYDRHVRSLPLKDPRTTLIISESLRRYPCPGCQEPLHADPFIVPPTWSKVRHYRTVSTVWTRAAKELSEAEYIYVIGYSVPPSDEFFRHFFALGTYSSNTRRRAVRICDPSSEVVNRFKNILGPTLDGLLRMHCCPFRVAIEEMAGDQDMMMHLADN